MRISREKVNHISKIIIDNLEKRDDFDYKAELNEVRLEITYVMNEYLKLKTRQMKMHVRYVRLTPANYVKVRMSGTFSITSTMKNTCPSTVYNNQTTFLTSTQLLMLRHRPF